MIHRNNIYRWLLMLAILPLSLTGCWEDDNYDICPDQAEKIQLTLTLPEQTRIATNTRATSSRFDYSIVNNINLVLVDKSNKIERVYYFDETGMTPNDGNVSMTRSSLPIKPEDGDNQRFITIVGNKGDFENIGCIYTVANYGKAIENTITTLEQLTHLKQTASDGQPNKKDNCMMFGSTTQLSNGTISLKRTLAMFSVKMDGTNLKEGVRITPTKISLHNVPTSCFIGIDNKINSKSESVATGQVVDVTNADGWGALTRGNTVGGHEQETGTIPMFMFENLQGTNDKITSIDQQITKHPKDFTGDINKPSVLQSFLDDGQKYTYILIEAEYYYQDPTNSNKGVQGSIKYRFMLGDNEYNDFNIRRNNYYQITLNLKENGGAREDGKQDNNGNLVINNDDLSWRVEMDIKDWGFVKDKFDFDSHAELHTIEILGDSKKWTIREVDLNDRPIGTPAPWVKFYSEEGYYGTHWGDPANDYYKYGKDGRLTFYVEPWYFEFDNGTTVPGNPNRRYMRLKLTNEKGEVQYVTFYQWKPIKISNNIYMERFEEGDSFSWGYNNTDISLSGFTFDNNKGLSNKFIWENATAMYNDRKSDAQMYCIQKSGYTYMQNKDNLKDSPSGTDTQYCLPDQKTLEAMIKYFKDNDNNITNDPDEDGKNGKIYVERMKNEDYWSVSVPDGNKKQTYIYSKEGNTKLVSDRDTKRRARAIYTVNPY